MRRFNKVVACALTLAMSASAAVGCGSADNSTSEESGTTTATAVEEKTESETEATETNSGSGAGSVYMLNFKPETDEAWQQLASDYKAETGVEVTVLTAADGQYNTTLQSEMAKESAPTIFNVGNSSAAQTWDDYTYDMSGTDLYSHLTDKSLVVTYNGKTAAVANCYEAYGIIYNKKIISDYATMDGAVIKSVDEINSLDKLEAVAKDINDRVDEINDQFGYELTEAFASAGLDDGSSWRFSGHLANLPLYYEFKDDGADLIAGEAEIDGTYLDNFKRVWDMYVGTSAADPKTLNSGSYNAETEFGMEEAVFYQNGDWEFSPLTNAENGYLVTAEDIGMLPIYFGVDDANEGLCVGTENYWAINAKADQADIDASLDFLTWCITSDEGRDAITNTMGLAAPYDTFSGEFETQNVFKKDANKLMSDGKTSVAWSFNATPNVDDWRSGVVSALTAYTDGSGDWDAVKDAFASGWAEQWKLAQEAQAE
ncbi:MAG: ABC transporter substrate-binding protein [Eubacterium sp.]|nr:ABC transporter substrate-binding protein [Eubacterium sp.]